MMLLYEAPNLSREKTIQALDVECGDIYTGEDMAKGSFLGQ